MRANAFVAMLAPSAHAEDCYDHGSVRGYLRSNGVDAAQMHRSVRGEESQVGFHQSGGNEGEQDENHGQQGAGKGIVYRPIFEDMKGRVAEAAEEHGRYRRAG